MRVMLMALVPLPGLLRSGSKRRKRPTEGHEYAVDKGTGTGTGTGADAVVAAKPHSSTHSNTVHGDTAAGAGAAAAAVRSRLLVTIDFKNVKLVSGQTTRVNDVSGAIRAGKFTAIMGGSGAGKTSLMMSLLGREVITAGQIVYEVGGRCPGTASDYPLERRAWPSLVSSSSVSPSPSFLLLLVLRRGRPPRATRPRRSPRASCNVSWASCRSSTSSSAR